MTRGFWIMTSQKSILFFLLFLLFHLLLLPSTSHGQEKRYANGLYLERFSPSDGLPSQSVHSLVSSKSGYLWTGSGFGITQFDGHTFKLYRFADASPPITSGDVQNLYEDSSGHLWFTVKGRAEVFRFDPESGTYRHFLIIDTGEKVLRQGQATALVAVKEDELWIGTASKGLFHLQLVKDNDSGEEKLRALHFPSASSNEYSDHSGPLSNTINGLLFHPIGDLWIATSKGLSRIKAGWRLQDSLKFDHFQVGDGKFIHRTAATA